MPAGLPTATLVEVELTTGVWTDVSTLVVGDSIEIAQRNADAGTLDLDFDNADGRFNPDNVASTYWPNFVEGKRIRVQVTKSATTYPVFHGHITELTPDYPSDPTQSKVHVLAVDLLGSLDRITLDTALKSHVQNGPLSSADFFFPCDDDGARRRASDLTGNCPPMTLSGGGDAKFATLSGLDGDSSQFLELSGGKRLEHKSPAFTWDWTAGNAKLCGFFYLDGTDVDGEIVALCRQPRSSALTYITIYQAALELAWLAYENGVIMGGGPAGSFPATAGWHAISLEGTGSTIQIYIDNVLFDTYTPSHSLPYRYLSVAGEPNTVGVANLISHVSATSLYMSQIVAGGVLGGTPNTLSQTETVIEGMTNLGPGLSGQITLSGSSGPSDAATALQCAGRSGLDVLKTLADSIGGIAYHDYSTSATQSIVVPGRDVTRSRTVAITVDAEADLDGGPTLIRSLADKLGAVTAKTPEASIRVAGTGTGSIDLDVCLDDEGQLRAAAEDVIAQGARLRTRLTGIAVDLVHAANDLYVAFFNSTMGSRLRLSGLPTTYFSETYIDGYIMGWVYRPGVDSHRVEFDLAPADAPREAIFGTSRWAFGDGVCTVTGGTAVGTTSTGTITLTWASGALLTTAAGDYPMDFDWNGERVTVTAAPAGGSSPRTLTITARGVAPTVARVHAAGESIEPWEAARWSL